MRFMNASPSTTIMEEWACHLRECGWERIAPGSGAISSEFRVPSFEFGVPGSEFGGASLDAESREAGIDSEADLFAELAPFADEKAAPVIEASLGRANEADCADTEISGKDIITEIWSAPDAHAPRIALIALAGAALPSPKQMFARYLDCPHEVRRILHENQHDMEGADFCLICDDVHEYWYEAASDACLGSCAQGAAGSYGNNGRDRNNGRDGSLGSRAQGAASASGPSQSAAGKSAADKSASEKIGADKPAADKPAADKPCADKPGSGRPLRKSGATSEPHEAAILSLAEEESRLRDRIWPRLTMDQAREGRLEGALERPVQTLGAELASWTSLWINELGSAMERLQTPNAPSPDELRRFFLLLTLMLKSASNALAQEFTAQEAATQEPTAHEPAARKSTAQEFATADRSASGGTLLRSAQTCFREFRLLLLETEAGDLGARFAQSLLPAFETLERLFPGALTHRAARAFSWVESLAGARPELLGKLAEEMLCLSSLKLTTDALVEALGDPETERVAWRQSVTARTEEFEQCLRVEGRNVLNPMRVNVDEEGLGWLLYCARWTARYWKQRIEAEREGRLDAFTASRARQRSSGAPGSDDTGDGLRATPPLPAPAPKLYWQMDLIMPWPAGVTPEGAIENILFYALGNSLRARADKPLTRMRAELLLFAMALEETAEDVTELPLPMDLAGIWEGSTM
ncbi:MAG: hypothetical protein NTX50_11290 [Candidatus Sumerlaeota bacterium]|nr:hypothetical protein [Candidatus Sumerlaeota bacterium]